MAKPKTAARAKLAPAAEAPVIEATAEEAQTETAVDETNTITTYDLVLDAARIGQAKFETQGAKETDQKYMHRLVTAISEIPEAKEGEEDIFDSLDAAVQEWYDGTVELIKGEKAIVMPDGFVSKFGNGAAAKVPKAPKAPKEKAPKEPKPMGWVEKAQRLALANPTLDMDGLKKEADKIGLVHGTLQVQTYAVRKIMSLAAELGLTK